MTSLDRFDYQITSDGTQLQVAYIRTDGHTYGQGIQILCGWIQSINARKLNTVNLSITAICQPAMYI